MSNYQLHMPARNAPNAIYSNCEIGFIVCYSRLQSYVIHSPARGVLSTNLGICMTSGHCCWINNAIRTIHIDEFGIFCTRWVQFFLRPQTCIITMWHFTVVANVNTKEKRKLFPTWTEFGVLDCLTCKRKMQYLMQNLRSIRDRMFVVRLNMHSDCIFENRNNEVPALMFPCTTGRLCMSDRLRRTSAAVRSKCNETKTNQFKWMGEVMLDFMWSRCVRCVCVWCFFLWLSICAKLTWL